MNRIEEIEQRCNAAKNPVRYYESGEPYVSMGGCELKYHPLVECLARLDRIEKYILPSKDAEVKRLTAELEQKDALLKQAIEDINFACGSQPSASDECSICDICKHKNKDGSCPKQCFMNSLGATNKWEYRGLKGE